MNIKYGKVETKRVIDDEGSTETVKEHINNSASTKPVRRAYEIKHRVTNEAEEFKEYADFSRKLREDKGMLDPAFRIEFSKLGDEKGYYYVVLCYTRLEY